MKRRYFVIYPFKVIESSISTRKQFDLTDGYQPSHALFYLKKGSFVIEINGRKEKINAGECVLLPDYVYFRRSALNPIEFIYIKFASVPKCPYSFDIIYGKIVPKDEQRFKSSISALEKFMTGSDLFSAGYREHLLMDILFQIFCEQSPTGPLAEKCVCADKLTSAAAEYIISNLNKRIVIKDICREVGTNASTLNFKFNREFGMSVGRFILKERVSKAKRLLIGTTYSMSQIATRCGFENQYYFSNLFKKHTGISPSQYRKGRGE